MRSSFYTPSVHTFHLNSLSSHSSAASILTMAMPPERISIKRRRSEDPVEALCTGDSPRVDFWPGHTDIVQIYNQRSIDPVRFGSFSRSSMMLRSLMQLLRPSLKPSVALDINIQHPKLKYFNLLMDTPLPAQPMLCLPKDFFRMCSNLPSSRRRCPGGSTVHGRCQRPLVPGSTSNQAQLSDASISAEVSSCLRVRACLRAASPNPRNDKGIVQPSLSKRASGILHSKPRN